jgi:hypothetical protein
MIFRPVFEVSSVLREEVTVIGSNSTSGTWAYPICANNSNKQENRKRNIAFILERKYTGVKGYGALTDKVKGAGTAEMQEVL